MYNSIKRLGSTISSKYRVVNMLDLDWFRAHPSSIMREVTRTDHVLHGMLLTLDALGIDYDIDYRKVDNVLIADSITIAGQRFDIGI